MWTKYSYVCTQCDSLIQITTNTKPVMDPGCICGLDTFVTRIALEPMVHPDVMHITPTEVVKINTNPYN